MLSTTLKDTDFPKEKDHLFVAIGGLTVLALVCLPTRHTCVNHGESFTVYTYFSDETK